jgi:hypothetical protein
VYPLNLSANCSLKSAYSSFKESTGTRYPGF